MHNEGYFSASQHIQHPLSWSIHWLKTLQAMAMVLTVMGGIHELEMPNTTPLHTLPLAITQAQIASLPPAIHHQAATRLILAALLVIRVCLAINTYRDVEPTWISPTWRMPSTLHLKLFFFTAAFASDHASYRGTLSPSIIFQF